MGGGQGQFLGWKSVWSSWIEWVVSGWKAKGNGPKGPMAKLSGFVLAAFLIKQCQHFLGFFERYLDIQEQKLLVNEKLETLFMQAVGKHCLA
jgi:hypothetical protein